MSSENCRPPIAVSIPIAELDELRSRLAVLEGERRHVVPRLTRLLEAIEVGDYGFALDVVLDLQRDLGIAA
jgi:hypothetical protein